MVSKEISRSEKTSAPQEMQNHDDSRERRAQEAIAVLNISGHRFGKFLLDLGCGQGHLDNKFLRITKSAVLGVDISFTRLQTAKINSPGCDFIVCDASWLPFKNSTFDTVISNDVLEHVSYSAAPIILKEVERVLDPRGKIYLSVMNRWEIMEPHWLIPFFTWMPRFLWDRMFPQLIRICSKANSANTNIRYTDHYFPYTKSMLTNLLTQSKLKFRDFTSFYAQEKINDPEYIGSSYARAIVKLLRSVMLTSLAIAIASKLSVLVFVCYKSNPEYD